MPDGLTARVSLAHDVVLSVPETDVALTSVSVPAPLARWLNVTVRSLPSVRETRIELLDTAA